MGVRARSEAQKKANRKTGVLFTPEAENEDKDQHTSMKCCSRYLLLANLEQAEVKRDYKQLLRSMVIE